MTPRRSTTWAAALATGLLATLAGTVPAEAAVARATAGCETVRSPPTAVSPPATTENTVRAFERAVAGGARSIESDLRLTSDGVWILMHDGTVNRTTNGTGRVAQMTLAQIKALQTDGGQRVPTFDEAVSALPAETGYQMEFKTDRFTDRQLMAVVNRLQAQTKASDLFLTSRFTGVLRRLSTLAPDLPRGLIMVKKERLAPSAIPDFVDSINISQTVADERYIARVHAVGKQVLARYANKEHLWARLVGDGVDRIVTSDTSATRTRATPEAPTAAGSSYRDFGV